MSPIPGAIRQIAKSTATLRQSLERSHFGRALADGTLPITAYGSLLRALHVAWSEIEHMALTGQSEPLRAQHAYLVDRRHQLERDLELLQLDPRGIDAAAMYALVLAQRIRRDAAQSTAAMIGYIEGLDSLLSSFTPQLAKCTELRDGGTSFATGLERRGTVYEALAATLDSTGALDHAITGARLALEAFVSILDVVVSNQHEDWLAGALNREAGQHPVPRDVREVQAALIAGERTRDAFRYYDARYGERGLRFTRSDSAWLVTVGREPLPEARRQIAWLGRLLSTRGMPRYLLESHLRELYAQLVRSVPDQIGDYTALDVIANEMAAERRRVMSDTTFDAVASDFAASTRGPLAPREAGTLLVAAVIDEKDGISSAVTSLCQWLDDPARVPATWREQIARVLERARAV